MSRGQVRARVAGGTGKDSLGGSVEFIHIGVLYYTDMDVAASKGAGRSKFAGSCMMCGSTECLDRACPRYSLSPLGRR